MPNCSRIRTAGTILLTLTAVGMMGAKCDPGAAIPTNNLQFWRGERMILGKLVGTGSGFAWGADELATVPQTPLDETEVRYESDSNRTELHLFSRDPEELRNLLPDLAAIRPDWERDLYEHAAYYNELWRVLNQWELPLDVFIPARTANHVYWLDLKKDWFWPNGEAYGPGEAPDGSSSVKAVRIYDHGACSTEVPLQPILEKVDKEIWAGFVDKIREKSGCTDAVSKLHHSMVYLAHKDKDARDLRGGFYEDIYFLADIHHTGFASQHIYLKYFFEFYLDTGVLNVQPIRHTASGSGYDIGSTIDGFTDAFDHQLPEDFHADALEMQTQDIFGESERVRCTPDSGDPCATAALKLRLLIQDGAKELGYTEDDADRLTLAANGYSPTTKHQEAWVCGSDTPEEEPFCKLTVRGKRLNVYPDAVELVWFDGKELDSPGHGLWVALHSPKIGPDKAAEALAALCGRKPAEPSGDLPVLGQRRFVLNFPLNPTHYHTSSPCL